MGGKFVCTPSATAKGPDQPLLSIDARSALRSRGVYGQNLFLCLQTFSIPHIMSPSTISVLGLSQLQCPVCLIIVVSISRSSMSQQHVDIRCVSSLSARFSQAHLSSCVCVC